MLENEHYHRWFGILPSEMPTHAYRMLGIELFEVDDAVIRGAIDQRQSQLRSYLQDADAGPATEMLSAIEQIGQCLLDQDLRETYDAQLRNYLRSRQSFVVRFDEPAESTTSSDLEILPDEEPNEAWITPASTFDAVSMVPIPTQATSDTAIGRRKKEKNIIVEMAKIVGGGIAGLVMGYVVLSFVYPDNDFFQSMGIRPINQILAPSNPNNVDDESDAENQNSPIGKKEF